MCLTIKELATSKDPQYFTYKKEKCGQILNRYVRTSKKNIYVYKGFRRSTTPSRLITPYMGTYISSNGDVMSTDKFTFRCSSYSTYFSRNLYDLRNIENGIHAYTRKRCVNYLCQVMLKCMIPAGTPYILGAYGDIVTLLLIVPPIEQ